MRHTRVVESVVARGLRASGAIQTLSVISRRLSPVETLVALDAALKAGLAQNGPSEPQRAGSRAPVRTSAPSPTDNPAMT